jgi:hypothetical protein
MPKRAGRIPRVMATISLAGERWTTDGNHIVVTAVAIVGMILGLSSEETLVAR